MILLVFSNFRQVAGPLIQAYDELMRLNWKNKQWLRDQDLKEGHGLAFALSFSEVLSEQLVMEGIGLLNLRREELAQASEMQLRLAFFQSIYKSFLTLRKSPGTIHHQYLQQIDPLRRACLFLRHKLHCDIDDLVKIFSQDRHLLMNELNLGRQDLIEAIGMEF